MINNTEEHSLTRKFQRVSEETASHDSFMGKERERERESELTIAGQVYESPIKFCR